MTFDPSASYTVAISRPMIPPPTTSSRLGIDGSSSAPVDEKIRSSSGSPGIVAASEPAAMMQLLERDRPTRRRRPCSAPSNKASPVITSTLRCLASPASPPVSLLDDRLLPRAEPSTSILRLGELDPVVAHLRGLGDDPGGMQQRLRGNATDVQAHSAERVVALDQHGLQAEVGGAERGGVAAGPGSDHDHLGVVIAAGAVSGRGWGRGAARARPAPPTRRESPTRRRHSERRRPPRA